MDSKSQFIKALEALKPGDLRSRWDALLGEAAPPIESQEMLALALAWRLQERASGGLSNSARRRMQQLIASSWTGLDKRRTTSESRLQPGTCLIREWRSETFVIEVSESGYLLAGQLYKSLSEVARVITGTRWNGPAFFGLRQPKAKTGEGSNYGR